MDAYKRKRDILPADYSQQLSSADVRYIHSFLTIGMQVVDLFYEVDAAKTTGPSFYSHPDRRRMKEE